jgi:hypothetical protein
MVGRGNTILNLSVGKWLKLSLSVIVWLLKLFNIAVQKIFNEFIP